MVAELHALTPLGSHTHIFLYFSIFDIFILFLATQSCPLSFLAYTGLIGCAQEFCNGFSTYFNYADYTTLDAHSTLEDLLVATDDFDDQDVINAVIMAVINNNSNNQNYGNNNFNNGNNNNNDHNNSGQNYGNARQLAHAFVQAIQADRAGSNDNVNTTNNNSGNNTSGDNTNTYSRNVREWTVPGE